MLPGPCSPLLTVSRFGPGKPSSAVTWSTLSLCLGPLGAAGLGSTCPQWNTCAVGRCPGGAQGQREPHPPRPPGCWGKSTVMVGGNSVSMPAHLRTGGKRSRSRGQYVQSRGRHRVEVGEAASVWAVEWWSGGTGRRGRSTGGLMGGLFRRFGTSSTPALSSPLSMISFNATACISDDMLLLDG